MQATELCAYVLSIDDPWEVKRVDVNEGGLRVDIHVGFRSVYRSWLGRTYKKKDARNSTTYIIRKNSAVKVWRHTNLGPLQAYVHVPVPEGIVGSWSECPIMQPWGLSDSPFTIALQRQVTHALEHSDSVQSVCRLLDVRMDDLRQYDKVMNKTGSRRASAARRNLETATTAEDLVPREPTTVRDIPDVSHPKWEQLMSGDLTIDVKALGLQMLLARVRMMMLQDLTEAERRAKRTELRNYFVKYHRFVQYELGQLFSH